MQTQSQIQEEIERHRADAVYFEAHRAELLDHYPEQWVAVYNQEVAGAAKDIKRLVRQLERKGIRPGRTYRAYLTEKEELFILLVSR